MAVQGKGLDPANGVPDQNNVNSADTQGQIPADPTNGVSGNSVAQQSPTSAPSDQNGQPDAAKIQAALREYGKLQQVQKELEELKPYKERYSNIESKALRSPEDYKWALMKFNDLSEADADAEVQRMRMQGLWGQPVQQPAVQPQGGATGAPQQDVYQVAEQIAKNTYAKEKYAESIQRQFFDRVPEMDPSKYPDDRKASIGTFAAAIEYEAQRRLKTNSSLNLVDTLVDVYKEFTGKTDEQLQQAKEQGRQQGYLEANAVNAQVGKPAKGFTPKESSFGLTPDQLAEAQAEGISPEDYAKYNVPVAQIE